MNTVLDGLNRLSFTIAPIFYKLLFLSAAALCIGFVIMLIRRFADSKISPSWKYAMWLLVLAALAVPYRPHTKFALLDPVAKVQELSYRSEYGLLLEIQHNSSDLEQGALEQPAILTGDKTEPDAILLKSFIFDVTIPLLWLAGTIIMALFLVLSQIHLIYRLKKHSHTSNLRSTALLQQCKTVLGIHCPVQLVTQDYIKSPALTGIVRPKIILPLYVDELEEENLRYILLHELSHYKRADLLLNNLLLVLQAVYWFNPLIWLLFRYLRQDMELANDAFVIKQIGNENSKNYLRSLVEVLSRYNQTSLTPRLLCMTHGRDNLERRIRMVKLGCYFKKNRFLTGIISIAVIGSAAALFLTQSSGSNDTDTMRWEKETNKDVSNPDENKLEAFKGLELYIWKNSELTGNADPYFTLLTGTNRNKEYHEIYNLDTAVSDILKIGDMLSLYADGLYLHIYQLNETDFTKAQMSFYADELSEYLPDNNSISIGLYELPLPPEVQKEEALTFFVKPDEPPQVIGEVAAGQWLNRFKDSNIPETSRISDYTIDSVTVMAVNMDENSTDRYDYLVEVQYNITTATDSYSTPENSISGKGTFSGLFSTLRVKALPHGSYEILNATMGENASETVEDAE